ncbi:MAG: leucine-rich repeat domain-containing protein [Verrucomicrobia bacterium]|nr:leucine-rich repeat domain-containing protein [Verrucomicrobiota bacterium]
MINYRVWLLPLLLLLTPPGLVQAQLNYTTNNGTITITGYTGSGGDVTIPSMITGLPVTSIGDYVFYNNSSLATIAIPNTVTSIGQGTFQYCSSLSSITIPTSVAGIGYQALYSCTSLTNITIGNGVTSIGDYALYGCSSLTGITIPNNVTNIGDHVFYGCTSMTAITVDAANPAYISVDGVLFDKNLTTLIQCPAGRPGSCLIPNGVTRIENWAYSYCTRMTSVTVPSSVASIGDGAFEMCTNLTGIYFRGDAPGLGEAALSTATSSTVYYLSGTVGWGPTFGGRPTALWLQSQPLILANGPSFGVQTNRFGFTILCPTNAPVVIEACTNLLSPVWQPLQTNIVTGGSSYFSDPAWAVHSGRFYRVRLP